MTETTPRSVSDQAIPSLLRSFPRWILWHQETQPDGKATKVPQASTKKPEQWSPWQQVEATPRSPQGGIGFVLTGPVLIGGFQLIALDCDGCRDPNSGELAPWVRALLDGAGFAEITPSGTGVRIWLLTDPGLRLAHAKLRMPKGPDVPKTPECQVFGLGPAGYVTVSGWPLTGHEGEIAYWPHERLHEVFGAVGSGTGCAADGATSLGGLPEGAGAPPGHEEILQALAAHPAGLALLAGAWEGLVPRKPGPDGKTPPATSSEAFWKLTQLVLRASRGHGQAAAKFLVRNCGEAWERANPKYGKLSWVEGEVARAAAKTNAGKVAEMAFEPLSGTGNGGSLFDDEAPGAAQDAPGSTKWRMRAWGEVCDDPPVEWLVDDLVPRGGLVVVGGEPSAGKTLLVLDAALRMAHGLPWLGKETKPASTLYLAGEGTPGLGARMRAWRAGNPDAKQIEGCYVALVDGVPNLAGLHAVTELLALMAQAQATYGKVPEVIVVDTLAMAAPGADENDAAAVGLVLRALAELRLRTGVTVELVHHTKKPQAGSGASGSLHALRGSSAIAGAADVVLLALVESDRKVLRTAKTRDGEVQPGVQYRVVGQRTGRMRADGRAEQGPVISQLVEAAPEIDAAAEEERNIARIVAAMDKLGTATRADTIVREAGMKLSLGRALLDKAAGRLLIKIDTVGRQKIYTSKMVSSPPHPPSLGRRGRPVGKRVASEDVLGTSGTSRDVINGSLLD